MSGLIAFLSAIPELMRLVQAMSKRMDLQTEEQRNKKKEIKVNVDKIAKAIKENDEKALNDVFNSI